MSLYVQESFVNATEGYRFGDSDIYETYTDQVGELYLDALREYGRCIGKVYIDQEDGKPIPVGWVFVKRLQYEDTPSGSTNPSHFYIRETWVTVHEGPEEVHRNRHYHDIRQPAPAARTALSDLEEDR